MLRIAYLFASCLLAVASIAQADTRLVYEGDGGQFEVFIRPGEIRINAADEAWQLYREQTNTIFAVDPANSLYTRMDENVAATLHRRMAELRDRIEAQIRELPEDRQDIAREALAEQIPAFGEHPDDIGL